MFNLRLPDPFEAFIIFSIRHEIRKIDLHKRDYSLLVPGLRNTIALDFHFSQSLLYWTDVVEDKIYRGKLSDTGGMDGIFISLTAGAPAVTGCETWSVVTELPFSETEFMMAFCLSQGLYQGCTSFPGRKRLLLSKFPFAEGRKWQVQRTGVSPCSDECNIDLFHFFAVYLHLIKKV